MSLPLNLTDAIHVAFDKSSMNVDMLARILRPGKTIHVQLPNERGHVLMAEVIR